MTLDRQITNEAPPEGHIDPGYDWAEWSPGSKGSRTAHQGGDLVNWGNWAISDPRTKATSWTINCDLSV